MDDLIYNLSPKAWFPTLPFGNEHVNQIQHSGTISAGDHYVESQLAHIVK